MDNTPLVSVVMPSLNQGEYIRESIESVLSQSYPQVELLVVDGASEDQTLDILRSYGKHFRWISEHDSGQSQAVNKGWREARGEIVTWLNADDLLHADSILNAVQEFNALPDDYSGIYGDCDYIDEEGNHLTKYPSRSFDYDRLVLYAEDYIPQPGTFIRKKWLEKAGMLDENLHFVMDYDLWLRLGMRSKLIYIPKKTSFARLHGAAKTASSAPLFGEELASIFCRLVDDPGLPTHLKNQRKIILSNAYLHAASYCFWGGETSRARFFLHKAWVRTPFPKSRSFWRLLFFSLAGRAGWKSAEILHGNPFHPRKGM